MWPSTGQVAEERVAHQIAQCLSVASMAAWPMTSVLQATSALQPAIRAAVPRMQAERRLPGHIVDAMRKSGVFDMALPRALGGPQLSPVEQFEVLEAFSLADASVGWCAMIGADSGFIPGFLDDATFAEVYPTRNLVTAGKVMPSGKAIRCPDGWRVTGRWDFGSGSTHADQFVGGVMLHDESGQLLLDDSGRPIPRVALLPRAHVTVHDTWNTIGMRATASNDYEVSDCPVPANWVYDAFGPMRRPDEPLYRLPWWFLVKHAGVLTGLARRAIDEAIGATVTKMVFPEGVLLIDRPGTLETIAHAEAAARSARAFLVAEIERVWAACVDDGDLSRSVTAPLRLAMVHASTVAVDVTRAMFDLLTTTSIATGSVFAQLVADAAVANTHVATGHRNWAPLGARLAGRKVPGATVFI